MEKPGTVRYFKPSGIPTTIGSQRASITLENMDSSGTASPMAEVNLHKSLRQLYEEDFALWIEATAACLHARDTERLDWESLLEEIEDLGKSEKRELESRLSVLLNHLLKRCHVELPDCYRGWQLTILEQRNALKRLLKQSPSLKPYLEAVLDEVYQDALAEAREAYPESSWPQNYPFSRRTDDLLSKNFWMEESSNA
jgi:hypothetical protein